MLTHWLAMRFARAFAFVKSGVDVLASDSPIDLNKTKSASDSSCISFIWSVSIISRNSACRLKTV